MRDPLLDELELCLREPNIFYALGLRSAEIRHSNFLAWLLDPKGNHGLGDYFLKRVLLGILSTREHHGIDEFDVDLIDPDTVEVRREWNHMDILIKTDSVAICVENKMHSTEHSGQLRKYREILNSTFPECANVFVYLTPHGREPEREQDALTYVSYSYADIAENLETVINLYSRLLLPKILTYLEDYLVVLRRDIMKEDKLNELAARIYTLHKNALDFIFENRPDRMSDILKIFQNRIEKAGLVLQLCQKGYARFLTPNLDKVIPKTGKGWKDKRIFLFEFDFWPKKISFKTVVSPGFESDRTAIVAALMRIPGAKEPKGEQWIIPFILRSQSQFDVTDPSHSDSDIEAKLDAIWPEVEDLVNKVESALLEVKDRLTTS